MRPRRPPPPRESREFVFNFIRARWRLRTSDRLERCQGCPYVFLCRGGCAVEAKLESGSYFSAYCGEFREVFAYTAPRAMGELWEESGDSELSASLCEPLARMSQEERRELMQASSGKQVVEILRRVGLVIGRD